MSPQILLYPPLMQLAEAGMAALAAVVTRVTGEIAVMMDVTVAMMAVVTLGMVRAVMGAVMVMGVVMDAVMEVTVALTVAVMMETRAARTVAVLPPRMWTLPVRSARSMVTLLVTAGGATRMILMMMVIMMIMVTVVTKVLILHPMVLIQIGTLILVLQIISLGS